MIFSRRKSVISAWGRSTGKARMDLAKCRVEGRTKTTVLSTNEPARDALAFDLLALIEGLVLVITTLCTRFALRELAVEGLNLCSPELEMAHVRLLVAAESNLRRPVRKHVQDLAVCEL